MATEASQLRITSNLINKLGIWYETKGREERRREKLKWVISRKGFLV